MQSPLIQGTSLSTQSKQLRRDFRRLESFVCNITRHAAFELGLNLISRETPSPLRNFYTEGLAVGCLLTPDAVEKMGRDCLAAAIEVFGRDEQELLKTQLGNYYCHGKPLPPACMASFELMEPVRAWEALSDLYHFQRSFVDHAVFSDDYRDIGICRQSALSRHKLVDVYNAVEFEEGPLSNQVYLRLIEKAAQGPAKAPFTPK